jgi:hydroxyethylthiazole kinase
MKTTISTDVLSAAVAAVRSQRPLVHNITNYVVMNNSANALLAIGASPVMAHWKEEMEEMTAIAGALVINIGTLDSEWIEGMKAAGVAASRRGIPVVLDPVGAGATSQRTSVAVELIELCKPSIIRGNASEIMTVARAWSEHIGSHDQKDSDSDLAKSKGVDSSAESSDAVEASKRLARESGAVVVISGETDYITDGDQVHTVQGGDPIMTAVTGMGCTATALTGAFAAVCEDSMTAAVAAMAMMSAAGEKAAAQARGNCSMQMYFLDELYNLTEL